MKNDCGKYDSYSDGGLPNGPYQEPAPPREKRQVKGGDVRAVPGGILGLVESHPNYVAGFKAGHAAGRARAALSQGWMPIETAPKDCQDVLLHFDGRAPVVAGWFRNGWAPMDLDGRHLQGDPTHWMPLPAAPKAADGEAK